MAKSNIYIVNYIPYKTIYKKYFHLLIRVKVLEISLKFKQLHYIKMFINFTKMSCKNSFII